MKRIASLIAVSMIATLTLFAPAQAVDQQGLIDLEVSLVGPNAVVPEPESCEGMGSMTSAGVWPPASAKTLAAGKGAVQAAGICSWAVAGPLFRLVFDGTLTGQVPRAMGGYEAVHVALVIEVIGTLPTGDAPGYMTGTLSGSGHGSRWTGIGGAWVKSLEDHDVKVRMGFVNKAQFIY